jgi:hypothetical protein
MKPVTTCVVVCIINVNFVLLLVANISVYLCVYQIMLGVANCELTIYTQKLFTEVVCNTPLSAHHLPRDCVHK